MTVLYICQFVDTIVGGDFNSAMGNNIDRKGSQWRIQDFPEAPTPAGLGANLLFGIIFAENCMKILKIGLRGACASLAPLGPPLSSDFNQ